MEIVEDDTTAIVVVPDSLLSLAIGKEGQNARLAARISGRRIDIKSVSAVEAARPAVAAAPAAEVVERDKGEPIEEVVGAGGRADL